MKRNKLFSFMVMVMMLPIGASCSSDSDDDSVSSFTSEEIIELLTGNWEVYGNLTMTSSNNSKYNKSIDYKARLAFCQEQYWYKNSYEFYINDRNEENKILNHFIYGSDGRHAFTIIKEASKNYITFGDSKVKLKFEITSLTKNTLKLIADQDAKYDGVPVHVRMTVISQ